MHCMIFFEGLFIIYLQHAIEPFISRIFSLKICILKVLQPPNPPPPPPPPR